MLDLPQLSIYEAAEWLKRFVTDNIPDNTPVAITEEKADELNQLVENTLALAHSTLAVDLRETRPAYEAIGWLSVMFESWFINSTFENHLLDEWAKKMLGV